MNPQCDIDLERGFLGTLLYDPQGMADAVGFIRDPSIFYYTDHQKIYSTMLRLFKKGKPFDIGIIRDELGEDGYAVLLVEISQGGSVRGCLGGYAERLNDLWRKRRLAEIGHTMMNLAESETPKTIISTAMSDMAKLVDMTDENFTYDSVQMSYVVADDISAIKSGKKIVGLKTGISKLDEYLSGVEGNELITIAGRSSQGKSTLTLNILGHLCFHRGKKALLFSIEMSYLDVFRRIMSSELEIDLHNIKTGKTTDEDDARIRAYTSATPHGNLRVFDKSTLSHLDVEMETSKYLREGKVDIIAVDYLGLMDTERAERREREVSEAVRRLKILGRKLHIPVINVVQLNRTDENERPQMRNLRESGDIENHSDFVLILHRWDDKFTPGEQHYELAIEKARNAPVGRVTMMFNPSCVKFRDTTMPEHLQMTKQGEA